LAGSFIVWARDKAVEMIWGFEDDCTKVLREKKYLQMRRLTYCHTGPWADISGLKTSQQKLKSLYQNSQKNIRKQDMIKS
jgi:hypothetical protein